MSQELKDRVLIFSSGICRQECPHKRMVESVCSLKETKGTEPVRGWLDVAKAPASAHGQVRLRQPISDIRKDGWMQTHTPPWSLCITVSGKRVWGPGKLSWKTRNLFSSAPRPPLHICCWTTAVIQCWASSLQKGWKRMRGQSTSWRRKQAWNCSVAGMVPTGKHLLV